jgi:hypothetical protein
VDKPTNAVIKITFSSSDCRPRPTRDLCFRSKKRDARRSIAVRTVADYRALQAARLREETVDFKQEYAQRAGSLNSPAIPKGRESLPLKRYSARLQLSHWLSYLIAEAQRIRPPVSSTGRNRSTTRAPSGVSFTARFSTDRHTGIRWDSASQ